MDTIGVEGPGRYCKPHPRRRVGPFEWLGPEHGARCEKNTVLRKAGFGIVGRNGAEKTHAASSYEGWGRAPVFQPVSVDRAFSIGIAGLPVRIELEAIGTNTLEQAS